MTHEEAIREWIARQVRARGHKRITRDCISDVQYAVDYGFGGSDVTPADNPEASLKCRLAFPGSAPHYHGESLEFIKPAELIAACLAIMAEESA